MKTLLKDTYTKEAVFLGLDYSKFWLDNEWDCH